MKFRIILQRLVFVHNVFRSQKNVFNFQVNFKEIRQMVHEILIIEHQNL